MKTVLKYALDALAPEVKISMPLGAKVLHVAKERGATQDVLCLWALVDTEAPTVPRWFRVYGTGHPLPEGAYDGTFMRHVGTVLMHGGAIVLHVFEVNS